MNKNSNIITKKKIPRLFDHKINITDENLSKKYFYINKDITSNKFKKDNIYKLLNNRNLGENFFKEVDNLNNKSKAGKSKLEKAKIDCIRSLILNNKKIPENWIITPIYKELLTKALEEKSILKFAIINKELHKKSSLNTSDEENYDKYLKEAKNTPKKTTISYINRYNHFFKKSPIKNKIQKEYCQSVDYKNKNNIEQTMINNSNNLDEKLLYNRIELRSIQNQKRQKLPKVIKLKKLKKIDNNEKNNQVSNTSDEEIKEELMLTSFYYTGVNKTENINDQKPSSNKNNNNRICIELPKII